MGLNIIVKDGASREQKQRREYASRVLKGYYKEECNGNYRNTGLGSKVEIRDGWKEFEHEPLAQHSAGSDGVPSE